MSERRVDELRGEGTSAGGGRLTVDAIEAREKLRKYRLPDPHLYVLQLVRAASALGATRVDFAVLPMTVTCIFDAVFDEELLRNLWDTAFAERWTPEEDAARYLALGIGAMQSFRPARISIRSNDVLWVIEEDAEQFGEPEFVQPKTEIVLNERFRFGRFGDFATRLAGEPPEVDILVTYCRFSSIPVTINGYRVDHLPSVPFESTAVQRENSATIGLALPEDNPRPQTSSPLSSGLLQTRPVTWAPRSVVRVLKRDVELDHASKSLPTHVQVGVGRIDAPNLLVDLTGLSPVKDDFYHETLDRLLFEAYHTSVAAWLEEHGIAEDYRKLLPILTRWAVRDWTYGDLPDATRRLLDILLEARVWRVACGPDAEAGYSRSVTEVTHDGVLFFATARFPESDLPEGRCLLQEQHVELETLNEIARLKGWTVANQTARLRRRSRRSRNIARWETQPARRKPDHRLCAEARVRSWTAVAYLPDSASVERIVAPTLRIFVKGRLLTQKMLPEGLSVDLDGPFRTNTEFDDVEVGDEGPDVLSAYVTAATEVVRAFVETLSPDAITDVQARQARRWLLQPAAGRRVARALALPDDLVTGVINRTFPELLDRVRCFRLQGRGMVSLRALQGMSAVHVLEQRDDWGDYARAFRGDDVRALLLVAPGQLEAYRGLLGPRFRDARRVLRSAVAARRFVEQNEPFEIPDEEALARSVAPVRRANLALFLQGPTREPYVEVHLLHRDREIARRRWPTACGAFRAVIRSHELRPNVEHSDVGPRELLDELRRDTVRRADELLDEWLRGLEVAESSAERQLLMEATVDRHGVDRLPDRVRCFQRVAEDGEVRLVSRPDVLADGRKSGASLLLVREPEEARSELPTLLLDRGLTAARARALFEPFALAFGLSAEEEEAAREAFLRRPTLEATLPDTAHAIEVTTDREGYQGMVGLDATENHGARPGIWLRATLEGREVETLFVPTAFGRFRAILTGPTLSADPSYTVILDGRRELTRFVREVAARVVCDMCDRFSPAGHSDEMEAWVPRLLRYAERAAQDASPPFDLADRIASSPMLRTCDGTNTSLARLARFQGAIPYADGDAVDDPGVLDADDRRLARLRRLLPEASFVDATKSMARLEVLLLARVAGELRRVRGPRDDLIGEELIRSMRWADDPAAADPICRVTREGIVLRRDARLFADMRSTDPMELGLAVSVVATEINRHYAEFTDIDELAIHRRLLREAAGELRR